MSNKPDNLSSSQSRKENSISTNKIVNESTANNKVTITKEQKPAYIKPRKDSPLVDQIIEEYGDMETYSIIPECLVEFGKGISIKAEEDV